LFLFRDLCGDPMAINSRTKGKVGELEFAKLLQFHGFDGRRGQQFSGGKDSPDVVSDTLADFHFEVKRKEAGNLYSWMAQAKADAFIDKIPVVMHRRNREEWVAILSADIFLELLHKAGYK
jgi:Holliday junction resolvase